MGGKEEITTTPTPLDRSRFPSFESTQHCNTWDGSVCNFGTDQGGQGGLRSQVALGSGTVWAAPHSEPLQYRPISIDQFNQVDNASVTQKMWLIMSLLSWAEPLGRERETGK